MILRGQLAGRDPLHLIQKRDRTFGFILYKKREVKEKQEERDEVVDSRIIYGFKRVRNVGLTNLVNIHYRALR